MYIRRGIKIFLAVITLTLVGGIFMLSRGAFVAQAIPVVDIPLIGKTIQKFIEDAKTFSLKKAATVAFEKTTERFLNRLAYETATFLAEGGRGGTSLQRRESFGRILQKTGEAALGDFIQDLSNTQVGGTDLTSLGLNLCNPSIDLKASLSLQLLDELNPPPLGDKGCNIQQIKENWRRVAQSAEIDSNIRFGSSFSTGFQNQVSRSYCSSTSSGGVVTYMTDSSGNRVECTTDANCAQAGSARVPGAPVDPLSAMLVSYSCQTEVVRQTSGGLPLVGLTANQSIDEAFDFLNAALSPEQSDLGIYHTLKERQRELLAKREANKKLILQTCPDLSDYYSKISDEYVSATCGELRDLQVKSFVPSAAEEAERLKGPESNLFINAAKIFGRTLVSKLLKRYISTGSFSLSQIDKGVDLSAARQNIIERLRSGSVTPQQIIANQSTLTSLAQLQRPSLEQIQAYDYLSNLTLCPQNRNQVELDNCTIDDDFAAAIRDQMSVTEAVASGYLRRDMPLISNLSASLNTDPFCIRNGYCHNNIVRLRKYRVLPLGWEIAASLSPIDNPVTLGEAIDCFDNTGACKLTPDANVYYRLIDPNWVLKAPDSQCRSFGYGPKLLDSTVADRQEYCADVLSCLAEDDEGNCIGGYGYCTQEKNTWRFDGTQCPADYASCSVVTRSIDGAQASYLLDTVELCDASDAGCKWFSRSKDNIGTIQDPRFVWNPLDRIYLNRSALQCDTLQAGCTEYISVTTPGVNLAPNGNFDYFTPNAATVYADPNWMNDDLPDTFGGWQGTAVARTTRDNAYTGGVGVRLSGTGSFSTRVTSGIVTDRTYTVSWYGKSLTASPNGCTADISIATQSTAAETTPVTYTPEWKQYELVVSYDPSNSDTSAIITFEGNCDGDDLFIDALKFELNNETSGFSDYGANGLVYLKSQNRCTKDDVGCDSYTPVSGGFPVPGRITSNDLCPAECVGYQNYLRLPSTFDTLDPASLTTPVSENFIANTATSCPATAAGCEEFTNLDEVANGGEGRYNFSYLRQCVEDALGVTYYTLEGSDTAGYQVRTWRLLKSNLVSGTNEPPCTNVNVSGTDCVDNEVNIVASRCSASQLNIDLNCREFFDLNGNPHYIKQDKVIFATNDCTQFRRTSTGTIFYGLQSDSRVCEARYNGCREYRGNQANNVRTLVSNTFEASGLELWSSNSASVSADAVTTGGHSMTNVNALGNVAGLILRDQDITLLSGREYYVDFWMKNTEAATVQFGFTGAPLFEVITVPVQSPWQVYRAGPLYIESAATAQLNVSISSPGGGTVPIVFFDNIVLKESLSTIFLVNNSWRTPRSCDEPVPGAMLGCQTYTNSNNAAFNLRSFSRLCSDQVLGCQAFIDTKNSTNPFQQIFNEGDESEILVPEDSIDYLVFRDEYRCFKESKGCTLFGEPILNRSVAPDHPQYITGYRETTLLANPDLYSNILCQADALFCEEYTTSRATSVYFKDPGARICEYRENQNVEGQLFTGWFRKTSLAGGTPVGCSDDGVLPYVQSDFENRHRLGARYDGWVAQCPSQYDLCTEFKDPLDTQGANTLTNAEFDNTSDWSFSTEPSFSGVPPADWFTVNPAQDYAILRVGQTPSAPPDVPYGSASFAQSFTDVDQSDIFSFSVEANIRQWPQGIPGEHGASARLTCSWDTDADTDYCVSGSAVPFSETCTTDADCSGGGVCNRIDFYWCVTNAGAVTNVACNDTSPVYGDARCVSVVGAGATCENTAYNPNNSNTDHVIEYFSFANTSQSFLNEWQTLRKSVDIGAEGRGKNLVRCDFRLSTGRGVRISPPDCDLANPGQDLDCFQTYCVDPATNSASATPQVCSTSSSVGGCGAGQECGGMSEVWWRNPVFKKAKGYFYLDNSEIDNASCVGQVGKKEGCLLFLDVSNRQSKLYSSFNTYDKSRASGDVSVSPVVCPPGVSNCDNDTNRIIKVSRDRQCSEWLACKSATEVFDPTTNSYRQVCDQVGVCNEYAPGTDVLSCKSWVTPSRQRLEYGMYVNRSIDYDSVDYSGYSVFNSFSAGTLEIVDVSTNGQPLPTTAPDERNPDYRMVRVIDFCNSSTQYDAPCGPVDPLVTTDRIGRCFALNKCVVGINGSRFSRNSDFVVSASTRLWAEKDSPFPYSVIENEAGDTRKVKFGFQSANICDSKNASCETSYYKFQYGTAGANIVRYYSTATRLDDGGITSCLCQGGRLDNLACNTDLLASDFDNDGVLSADERCPDGGSPVYLRRAESFLNLPGYCLQEDARAGINGSPTENACLLWLPVDNAPVGFDFYNQNREAGYSYKIPAYYCMEAGIYERRAKHKLGNYCKKRPPRSGDPNYYIVRGERGILQRKCHDSTRYIYYAVPKAAGTCTDVFGEEVCQPGQDGYYDYDGNLYAWSPVHTYDNPFDMGLEYRETLSPAVCSVLAQAVDERGENAAITNRFWPGYGGGAGYTIDAISPPLLSYTLNQDDVPFGSAVPAGIGFLTDVLSVRNTKDVPRAGSPYACSADAQTCAFWNQDSGNAAAIQGWRKSPPFAGDENYAVGVERLKEVYKKIFRLYRWGEGNTCSNMICGGTIINSDNTVSGSGGYFGGQGCDPSDTNACVGNPNITSCAFVNNVCVNSVFNNSTDGTHLFRGCAKCPIGFETEQTPNKRCRSMQAFSGATAAADCNAYVFDPLTSATCGAAGTALAGYSCAQDPLSSTTLYRCISNQNNVGRDCKIPYNPDGSLVAANLSCRASAGGGSTCFYMDEDTGVGCNSTADCIANNDGVESTIAGDLSAINQTSFCADEYSEGAHDFGGNTSYCVGAPFTGGSGYVFETMVRCNQGAITNALGYPLANGDDICKTQGQCVPSHRVRNLANEILCVRQPEEGYIEIPQSQLDPSILPLDETASENPTFSPYIIPVVCDATGVNCFQSVDGINPIATSAFRVPTDNGFSVNNKVGSAALLEGFQNYLVSVRFYMAAHKDHMPIRFVDIDWGDGSRQARVGYYKNHFEQCGETNAQGPITTPQQTLEYAVSEQACREAFRNYLHVYAWNPNFPCPGEPNASCYTPRVMVQDNWGWCTNNVYGQVGSGCKVPGADPLPPALDTAYVEFPGVIKVYKDPQP